MSNWHFFNCLACIEQRHVVKLFISLPFVQLSFCLFFPRPRHVLSMFGVSLNSLSVAEMRAAKCRPSSTVSVLRFLGSVSTGYFVVWLSCDCAFLHLVLSQQRHPHPSFPSQVSLCKCHGRLKFLRRDRAVDHSSSSLNVVLSSSTLQRVKDSTNLPHRHKETQCFEIRSQEVSSALGVSLLPASFVFCTFPT